MTLMAVGSHRAASEWNISLQYLYIHIYIYIYIICKFLSCITYSTILAFRVRCLVGFWSAGQLQSLGFQGLCSGYAGRESMTNSNHKGLGVRGLGV